MTTTRNTKGITETRVTDTVSTDGHRLQAVLGEGPLAGIPVLVIYTMTYDESRGGWTRASVILAAPVAHLTAGILATVLSPAAVEDVLAFIA